MNRRSFLGAMLAACAAPAVVRSESIMRVKPIVLPGDEEWGGALRITAAECTPAALEAHVKEHLDALEEASTRDVLRMLEKCNELLADTTWQDASTAYLANPTAFAVMRTGAPNGLWRRRR